MNYLEDIKIDENSLDIEWLQQPKLMLQYAQHAAYCSRELDAAKEAVNLVKAELDREIRTNPEKYKISKITETAVANTILEQDEYKIATEEVTLKKYEFDIARAVVQALDQKKTALENLVKLFGQQYFAGPKVPRDLSYEWQQKQKQTESNNTIKIGRRK